MKRVWITGASSGLGAAMAREYAARGHALILSARRMPELEGVRASLPHPERIELLPLDLSDADRAVEAPAVDVLVNNAGITQRGLAADTELAVTRRIMEVNFFAAVALAQRVLPAMRAADRGQIVFVSSVAGYVATPLRSSYSAAKHAIRAYADALRAELHGTAITVSTVIPGYIATGISALALTADGSPRGAVERTDAQGIDPERAARQIVDGLERGRAEVVVGGPEVAAIHLKRLAPGLVNRLLHRFAPK